MKKLITDEDFPNLLELDEKKQKLMSHNYNKIYIINRNNKVLPEPGNILYNPECEKDFYILSKIANNNFICISLLNGMPWRRTSSSTEDACHGLTLFAKNAHITINNKT